MRNKMIETFAFFLGEINFHVGRMFAEVLHDFFRRGTDSLMDLVDLIKFVISREKRTEWQNLKHNAADSPDVHFVRVITIS